VSVTAADLLRGLYRVRALERASGRDPDPASMLATTATAFALASRPPDLLTIGAGAVAATVLRGLDARELALHQAEWGASGHPTRPDLGLLGPVVSRGVSLSVAAGAALAFGLRKEPRVAVVVDDASALESGGWHEGFALAAARGVPLVAVLLHGTGSSGDRSGLRRAEAYGVHFERLVVDDADAVARRIHGIVDSARAKPAPWLLEVVNSERDPIARLETRVIVAEPEDPASMSARDRLARWESEAEAEAQEAWSGLEVAA
jgi:pyruvate dehydrogenase E1 component alpha subunit